MTFKPFCDNQIHTQENPCGYDCLIHQLEGHNCVCGYTPQNIFCEVNSVHVASKRNSEGGLVRECHNFEIHQEFLKLIGQPPYNCDTIRALAETSETAI
jgi:hypothetical protein